MAPLITITIQALLSSTGLKQHAFEVGHQSQLLSQEVQPTSIGHASLSAISWGLNRLDVYNLDKASENLAHKWWDGYQWGPNADVLENLGGDFVGSPAAVTWGANRADVFALNNASYLSHKYWDGSAWKPSVLGAEGLAGGPWAEDDNTMAVTAWGTGRLDVFGRSTEGELAHKYYDGSSWQPEGGSKLELLGGRFASSFAAISKAEGRLDIVGIDTSGKLLHLYYDGTKWSNWEDLQAPELLSTPTVTTWGKGRLDIYGVSLAKGELHHLAYDGSKWLAWDNLGGKGLIGPVAANSWSENRLDIVALGADKGYYYKFWDGSQWRPQKGDEGSVNEVYPKGGSFASLPAVVSWGANRLDIFGETDSGQLGHQTWYGSGWYPEWGFENLGVL